MAYSQPQAAMMNLGVNRKWAWWGGAALVVVVLTAYPLWLTYERSHWMTQVEWATVEVDERPVQAEVYIGYPTHSEAEAFLLIHSPAAGDYFLSFGNENYRVAKNEEFIRLLHHVWILKPIGDGHFIEPLPFARVNEFRISSDGHLVTVQF